MKRLSPSSKTSVRLVAGVALALCIALASGAAGAQPATAPDAPGMGAGMHARGMGPGMMMRHRANMGAAHDRLLALADKLQLTDAQQTKLRQIRRSAPAALMPKRQAVMEARLDLADLMAQTNATTADLRKANDKLLQARQTLASAAFDLRLQAREVLTPEQRDKLHKDLRPGGMGMGRRGDAGFGSDFEPGDDGALDFGDF